MDQDDFHPAWEDEEIIGSLEQVFADALERETARLSALAESNRAEIANKTESIQIAADRIDELKARADHWCDMHTIANKLAESNGKLAHEAACEVERLRGELNTALERAQAFEGSSVMLQDFRVALVNKEADLAALRARNEILEASDRCLMVLHTMLDQQEDPEIFGDHIIERVWLLMESAYPEALEKWGIPLNDAIAMAEPPPPANPSENAKPT